MEGLSSVQWIDAGGPVMIVLAVMSVVGFAIVLMKAWQFIASRISATAFIGSALQHWREGAGREALALTEKAPGPVAEVMSIAMRGQLDPRLPEDRVREEVMRVAAAKLEDLRCYLRGLEVIGSLAPLIGLLGTVLGMIEAFQSLQAAGTQVDPAILSGGIWEALLTTAAGLIVAIPAVALLNFFERAVERVKHRMEDAVTQVFTQHPHPEPARAAA